MVRDRDLEICDFTKMIMMLCVVLYHSAAIFMIGTSQWGPEPPVHPNPVIGFLASWLDSIHVYTFTAVSGYLYFYLKYEAKHYTAVKNVILKKVKRLLVPYVMTCVFWVIPFHLHYFHAGIRELVIKYLIGIAPSQLWFLLMLFWVFTIFSFLDQVVDFKKASTLLCGITFLMSYYASLLLSRSGTPNIWQILKALQYLLFFYLGMCMRKMKPVGEYRRWQGGAALAVSIGLFTLLNMLKSEGGGYRQIATLMNPFVSVAGVIAAMILCHVLAEIIDIKSSMVRRMEESSMAVYLFHQQLVYVSIKLFNKPGIPSLCLVILNFTVSFWGSYILYNMGKRLRKVLSNQTLIRRK